jgi:phage head maturation protease
VGNVQRRNASTRAPAALTPPTTPDGYIGAGAEWLRAAIQERNGIVAGPATFDVRQPCRVSTASARLRLALLAAGAKSEDVSRDQLTITGTALVCGVVSSKPDSTGTRVMFLRGAFTRYLSRTPPPDLAVMFNFRSDFILGRMCAGTAIIYERGDLLMYECQPPDTSFGRDLLVSVGRSDITGSAAAAVPTVWNYIHQNGERIRVIQQADLFMGVAITSFAQFDKSGLTITNPSKTTPTRLPTSLSEWDRVRAHGLGVKGQAF